MSQAIPLDLRQVDQSELAARLSAAQDLVETARPHLEWLAAIAVDRPQAVCILDADAVVLVSLGDPALQKRFGLLPGYDWSEATMGASCVAAALETDRPASIVGTDHSCRLLHEIAGAAAPIHVRGLTWGVLDLVTRVADSTPDQLALVSRVALEIEREFDDRWRDEQRSELEASLAEHTRAEEALRESEERFRLLVESWAQSVWEADASGELVADVPSWREYTGQATQEFLGWGWLNAVHPDDRDRVEREWRESVRTGNPLDTEFRLRHHAGGWRWTNDRAAPLRNPDGSIRKWVGMNIDITARKHAEEALQHADRRKNEFLATLAHELRNPLAPIRHATKIAKAPNATEAQRKWAHDVIDRQIAQMARLLDDLLEASRISRGKLELRTQRTDLRSALESAIEAAWPLIEAKHHSVSMNVPDEPVWLEADPLRLSQIFTNLLTNAAKYTDPRGRITVRAVLEDASVVVRVRDTGIGIAPEMLPRIFHMFSQAHTALDRSEGGLGIGLALVHGLVELHGGVVEAHSEGPGHGSEFIVRLPVLADPIQTGDQPATRLTPQFRRKVLVADDNQDSAESLAMMLRLVGHTVEVAHDGRQALTIAAIFRPDVVLLDIGMPELSGYEVAEQIRAEPWGQKTTLVAVTGWGQEEDKRRASRAGFDHHFTKPVEPEQLEQLLSAPLQPESAERTS